jgi:hypothetical protein
MNMNRKTPGQLDREIAQALVESRMQPPHATDKVDVLRVKLPRGLGSTIARTQHALFVATHRTSSGYTFESSDGGTIRALWRALNGLYYHPPSGTPSVLWRAAGKKLAELRPIIAASWPEALSE